MGAKLHREQEPAVAENGFLLGQGRIDFAAVRKAMDDIGYSEWIQIEGAVPKVEGVAGHAGCD